MISWYMDEPFMPQTSWFHDLMISIFQYKMIYLNHDYHISWFPQIHIFPTETAAIITQNALENSALQPNWQQSGLSPAAPYIRHLSPRPPRFQYIIISIYHDNVIYGYPFIMTSWFHYFFISWFQDIFKSRFKDILLSIYHDFVIWINPYFMISRYK